MFNLNINVFVGYVSFDHCRINLMTKLCYTRLRNMKHEYAVDGHIYKEIYMLWWLHTSTCLWMEVTIKLYEGLVPVHSTLAWNALARLYAVAAYVAVSCVHMHTETIVAILHGNSEASAIDAWCPVSKRKKLKGVSGLAILNSLLKCMLWSVFVATNPHGVISRVSMCVVGGYWCTCRYMHCMCTKWFGIHVINQSLVLGILIGLPVFLMQVDAGHVPSMKRSMHVYVCVQCVFPCVLYTGMK